MYKTKSSGRTKQSTAFALSDHSQSSIPPNWHYTVTKAVPLHPSTATFRGLLREACAPIMSPFLNVHQLSEVEANKKKLVTNCNNYRKSS